MARAQKGRGAVAARGCFAGKQKPSASSSERLCGLVLRDDDGENCDAHRCSQRRAPRSPPAAAKLSRPASRAFNDRNDTHDRYTSSLIHRQEQASAYYRALQHDLSRPSSSSGSAASGAPSLRRVSRFEAKPSRLRSSSADSPPYAESPELESCRPSHRRATSAHYTSTSYEPHPALRLSRRTKAAVAFALEAVRAPEAFTPFLAEENAQMSELGAGRASNGGARTGGPVPVSTGTPTGMKTPRDVMRERNAREARRQEEQRAEEQRRLAEERRKSAERRAAAVSGGAPRFSQGSSQYTPDVQQGQFDSRGSTRVAGSDAYGDPIGRTSQNYDAPRPLAPSMPQQPQQRSAQPTASAGGARRTQQSQSAPRQPASSTSGGAQQPQQPSFQSDSGQPRQSGASSFPHAFERWETLSSHWEGLTSYWIRRLEQNTEEIKDSVPNAVTLNRQITDLSAAGANLFHAVVELQRLRASSERKFQRWFFETRAETEKNRETSGQVENQLKLERSAREEAARQRVEATIQAENARRETAEMKRELNIAKDEARRAWEELGRRNQESLETAQNLKDGRITLVGGVQVVPYFGGPSRSGTGGSQRPVTRDGQPVPYSSTGMASAAGAAGLQSPGDDERYYRQEQEASPTNTDPFMESGAVPQPLHHEPGRTSLAAGTYQPAYGDTPTTASTAQTAIPTRPSAGSPDQSRTPRATDNVPMSAAEAQRFYQQPPQQTFLHSPPGSSGGQPTSQGVSAPREDVRSDGSYVGTSSENDTEYAFDSHGNIRYDEQGRPLIYRRRNGNGDGNGNGNGGGGSSGYGATGGGAPEIPEPSDDDEYDTEAMQREQELSQQYGSGGGGAYASEGGEPPPEAPTVPSTAAQAMATYQPTTSGGPSGSGGSSGQGQGRPDYSGQDYGPWEAIQTRHHHPTRLSDVLEEEEDRSSRRTGPE